jgi:hypothetical protein
LDPEKNTALGNIAVLDTRPMPANKSTNLVLFRHVLFDMI